MDMSSPHILYILGAYALGAFVFTLLTYWVVREDRKASKELRQWKSDVT
jgi:heme exporter protein CcmD